MMRTRALFTRPSPQVKRAEDMLRDTLKGVAKASELDALTPEDDEQFALY